MGIHIFVEICPLLFESQWKIKQFDLLFQLFSIPQIVEIMGKITFILHGPISFLAPFLKSKQAIGYYISYYWKKSNNHWKKYDDLQKTVRPITIAEGCLFLIFTI